MFILIHIINFPFKAQKAKKKVNFSHNSILTILHNYILYIK